MRSLLEVICALYHDVVLSEGMDSQPSWAIDKEPENHCNVRNAVFISGLASALSCAEWCGSPGMPLSCGPVKLHSSNTAAVHSLIEFLRYLKFLLVSLRAHCPCLKTVKIEAWVVKVYVTIQSAMRITNQRLPTGVVPQMRNV